MGGSVVLVPTTWHQPSLGPVHALTRLGQGLMLGALSCWGRGTEAGDITPCQSKRGRECSREQGAACLGRKGCPGQTSPQATCGALWGGRCHQDKRALGSVASGSLQSAFFSPWPQPWCPLQVAPDIPQSGLGRALGTQQGRADLLTCCLWLLLSFRAELSCRDRAPPTSKT